MTSTDFYCPPPPVCLGAQQKVVSSKSLLVVRVNMFASLASAMTPDDQPGNSMAAPLLLLLRELLPSLLFLANCGSEDEVMAEVRTDIGR